MLSLVHDPDYIAVVRATSLIDDDELLSHYGLGGRDNPVFDRMHEASALVTGGTVDAARAVRTGKAIHAVNLAGGMHHAMPSKASGFCVYNDAAVAIAWLLSDGVSRVAYVDVDAHHGDGVEAAFEGDPRVLTISLHESGYTAFPGTGFPENSGDGDAEGTVVNVALPPHTADSGWLRAFHAVVPPLLRAFEPEILVTQLGCDTHRLDPLAQLNLTVDGHRACYAALHELAHEVCGGRWVAVGGGGYAIVRRRATIMDSPARGDHRRAARSDRCDSRPVAGPGVGADEPGSAQAAHRWDCPPPSRRGTLAKATRTTRSTGRSPPPDELCSPNTDSTRSTRDEHRIPTPVGGRRGADRWRDRSPSTDHARGRGPTRRLPRPAVP